MRQLVVISVLLPIGGLVIFVTDPSARNGFFAALGIICIAGVWAIIYTSRRLGRGAPRQLVATTESISSPAFTLAWDRVDRMRIGHLSAATGGLRALFIEPTQLTDIRWANSRLHKLDAKLIRMTGGPPIRILEANIDRPLEELAAELEARAGRPLLDRS